MTTTSGQKSYSTSRKVLRYKLEKYPKLKNLAIKAHAKYCDITNELRIKPNFYIIGCVFIDSAFSNFLTSILLYSNCGLLEVCFKTYGSIIL